MTKTAKFTNMITDLERADIWSEKVTACCDNDSDNECHVKTVG